MIHPAPKPDPRPKSKPHPISRIGQKKLAALNGKVPFSTVTGARKPVKKRNAERRRSEFARAYGSRERVRFVKRLPCPVCVSVGMPGDWTTERDNAHIIGGGAGRKADFRHIVPLCRHHHRALHAAGSLSAFYVTFGCRVDLAACAANTESAWQLQGASE